VPSDIVTPLGNVTPVVPLIITVMFTPMLGFVLEELVVGQAVQL
jgi:hypothetical protein